MTDTNSSRRPRAPQGLRSRGKRYWKACHEAYEFTDSELNLLEEICRILDNLDLLAASIAEDGVSVEGSSGQKVVNAALTESRGQQITLYRLTSALALPSDEGAVVPSGHVLRSAAGNKARWADSAGPALREVR